MTIQLIYPPWRQPFMPPLSLAALTGFLEAEGVACRQRDLNLEIIEHLLEPEWLERTGNELRRRIAEIEQNLRVDGETALFHESLVGASLRLPVLAGLAGEARQIMRDPARFYRLEEYRRAMRAIEETLRVVSLAWSPCWFRLHAHRSAAGDQEPGGPAEQQTAGGEERLLTTLYEQRFIPTITGKAPELVVVLADYRSQLLPALTLLRLVRRSLPGVRTAMTGWMAEELLDRPPETDLAGFIDILISGRPEEPVLRLARDLEGGAPDHAPWLDHRGPGNPPRVVARPLPPDHELPAPSFQGLPLDRYLSPHPVLPLRASAKAAEQIVTLAGPHRSRHYLLTGELDSATADTVAGQLAGQDSPPHWFATLGPEHLLDEERCRRLAAGGCVKLQLLVGTDHPNTDLPELEQAGRAVRSGPPAGIGIHLHCRLDEETGGRTVTDLLSAFFRENGQWLSGPGFSFSCRVVRAGRRGPAYGGSPPDLYNDATAPVPGSAPGFGRDPGDGDLPSENPWEEQRWRLVREAGAAMNRCLTPGTAVHDFLYLSHFDGNPPAPPAEEARGTGQLETGLVLRPSPGLNRGRFQAYDPELPAEGKNASGQLVFIAAGPRWHAAAGDGYRCRPLPDLAVAILEQCDGARTWDEAVRAAGTPEPADHDLPQRLVRMMFDEGLLVVA